MRRLAVSALIALTLGLGLTLALLGGLGHSFRRRLHAQGNTTRYVALSGEDSGDCSDSASPCRTVQYAVEAASHGDEIRVATGVYTQVHYEEDAGRQVVVFIEKTVSVRGGYTTTDWDTPDPEANPTTMDAQDEGRVLYITGDISPTIEGFRITGGVAEEGGGVYIETAVAILKDNYIGQNTAETDSLFEDARGGGVYLKSSSAILVGNTVQGNSVLPQGGGAGVYLDGSDGAKLVDNVVQGNQAQLQSKGGGLYARDSVALLTDNTVVSNTGGSGGGGLYLDGSDIVFSGNTVSGNDAFAGSGGGLYVAGGALQMSGNFVAKNTALDDGGALFLQGGHAALTNTMVTDNQAGGVGSGLHVSGASPRLLHTTLARNTGGDGSGIHVASGSVALTNTILVSHTVGITVTGGSVATLNATLWSTGTWGNLTDWGGPGVIATGTRNYRGDPAFVNPDAGDYHIGEASAARDRGVGTAVSIDIDNEPRLGDPDLGADEYWAPGSLRRVHLPLVMSRR